MVLDARRLSVFIIDREVIDNYGPKIGPNGIAMYALLARMANANGESFPSAATAGVKLGIAEETARKALKLLEAEGLITVTRRKGAEGDLSNLYTLTTVAKVEDPTPVTLPTGNLYERTVGRVGASDNKIATLADTWREVFGHTTTPGAMTSLVKLAGGDAEAVARAMISVVAFFGTVEAPFNAMKRQIEYQNKGSRSKSAEPKKLVIREPKPPVATTKRSLTLDTELFGEA